VHLILRATAVASVTLLALTTTGCGKQKAAAPPADLCALAADPPVTTLVPGGEARHRSKKDKLTSTAECEVEAYGGGTLTIELSRHGDTSKRKAASWAKRQYESARKDTPWDMRCAATDIRGLGSTAFSCAHPGDPGRAEALYAEVSVRKGKDVLSLTLIGGDTAPEVAVPTLRRHAEQILARL
jgi:hypothetical protein